MSKEDKTRRRRLFDMTLNAKTLEQVREVTNSEEYREASALEVVLVGPMLACTMLKLQVDHIEEEMRELEEAVDHIRKKSEYRKRSIPCV